MDGRLDGRTVGWTDGWLDGRTDGWLDGRMVGRMDGWTDGRRCMRAIKDNGNDEFGSDLIGLLRHSTCATVKKEER